MKQDSVKTILLFRHGMTEMNERKAYCGSIDVPLSARGIADLIEKKSLFSYPDIKGFKVVHSGMKRTLQTIKILYPNACAGAVSNSSFKEIDFGVFEGLTYEELKQRQEYKEWISGDNEANICPGGESGNMMKNRVLSSFSEIAEDSLSYAVFTHGGPIACIMEYLFPEENKNRWQWQCGFGEGYALYRQEGNGKFLHETIGF